MGWRAREAVVRHFEQEVQTRLLESFYEEAIAMRSTGEPAKSEALTPLAPQFVEQVTAN